MAEHLKHPLDYIRFEHAAALAEISTLLLPGEMTFDLMWAVLLPGTIFFTHCAVSGEPRAVRLISAEKRTPHMDIPFWRLECEYIEAWGSHAAGS